MLCSALLKRFPRCRFYQSTVQPFNLYCKYSHFYFAPKKYLPASVRIALLSEVKWGGITGVRGSSTPLRGACPERSRGGGITGVRGSSTPLRSACPERRQVGWNNGGKRYLHSATLRSD
ncbi:MAG: hypothetical protein LBK47_01500 [Prevotellaceae bacterium]|nr:hypothetical protein [Prevotellaceae bacterium]